MSAPLRHAAPMTAPHLALAFQRPVEGLFGIAGLGRPRPFAAVAARLALWRQRRTLASLDDARLSDIGLTREEAFAEARRPFWDAPSWWR